VKICHLFLRNLFSLLGFRGINDCPAEKMIPLYLLVGGIACIFVLPVAFTLQTWEKCVDQDGRVGVCLRHFNVLFLCVSAVFFFVWFICGNVWVFRTNNVHHIESNSTNIYYCDELTFKFAYWVIIATYICSVLSCVCTACIHNRRVSYDQV